MKKQKGSPRGEAGQTLLEILLAFGVLILALSAVILGIATSLSNGQYTKNQGLANSYAQEGMAVIRQIRDSDWANFISKEDPSYCLGQEDNTLTSPLSGLNCGQNVGIFMREVKFVHNSDDCSGASTKGSRVIVTVSWSDNKCPIGSAFCHKVELITCFFNLNQEQAP